MITAIVVLHLLTHEVPVILLGLFGCYKYFNRRQLNCCSISEAKSAALRGMNNDA